MDVVNRLCVANVRGEDDIFAFRYFSGRKDREKQMICAEKKSVLVV